MTLEHVHRFTQAGIFLALTWPCFFLSTILGSRVTHPAEEEKSSQSLSHVEQLGRAGALLTSS